MRHLACTLLLISLATAAGAQNYFPLDTGLVWTYTDGAGSDLEGTVLGPVEYNGLTVVELQYLQTGANAQEYHNFWTREAGGVTWLHGAWNASGFSATYDPPILYIEAPLYQGLVWTTVFGYNGEPSEATYEVFEEGDTTVPMGTFYAYGIGAAEPPLPAGQLAGYDLLGRRLDGGTREASRWYTENIGMIRYLASFELVSFSGSVATEQTTWTGVKALFIQ